MSRHVFTYGSLMFAPIWRRVVRGDYRQAPATLAGHARFAIVGEAYPGMIAHPGASVAGVLYFDVDAKDVDALDAFEGADYSRRRVSVRLASGEAAEANTYLYLLPQNLSESPWLPEEFQMRRFIASCCEGWGEGEPV